MSKEVPADFIELLTEHQTRLQSYIGSLLANKESTWDVLQETNRVLIEKRDDYVRGTSFVNWSLTVAQFQVMAWLRDQKRDRHILTPELADVFSKDSHFVSWRNRDLRISALEECLQLISGPNRELIRRRYADDESLEQISIKADKSINALKQTFFRVRKSLLQCIEERFQSQ